MLSEQLLLHYKHDRSISESAKAFKRARRADATLAIFLSHSHKDRDLIEGFLNLFAIQTGMAIYVDWQDSEMPRITSRETAERIKIKIQGLPLFFVLATNNAVTSRWVPWEIGVADSIKPYSEIFIIPVASPDGQFQGNEYLQLYQSIQLSPTRMLEVRQPNATRGVKVQEWFLNR